MDEVVKQDLFLIIFQELFFIYVFVYNNNVENCNVYFFNVFDFYYERVVVCCIFMCKYVKNCIIFVRFLEYFVLYCK